MKTFVSLCIAATCLVAALSTSGAVEYRTWTGDYVPVPHPVVKKTIVAVYKFPGCYQKSFVGVLTPTGENVEWKKLTRVPFVRPVLGAYDETNPEVNDWMIYWALESGIDAFIYDWYWNGNTKSRQEFIEQGFLRARYASKMKFAILWCNQEKDSDTSRPAMLDVTRYWIAHYFKQPNYLKIDGRPSVWIYMAQRMLDANGGPAGFRQTLAAMNGLMHQAGLPSLHLVGEGADAGQLKAAGFDAASGYSTMGLRIPGKFKSGANCDAGYDQFVRSTEEYWRIFTSNKRRFGFDYILPIGTRWNNTPRYIYGGGDSFGDGYSAGKYGAMLDASKRSIDHNLDLVVLEAWDEWGEGSYLCPDEFDHADMLGEVLRAYAGKAQKVVYLPSPEKVRSWSTLTPEEDKAWRAITTTPDYCRVKKVPQTFSSEQIKSEPAGYRELASWRFTGPDNQGWSIGGDIDNAASNADHALCIRCGAHSSNVTVVSPPVSIDCKDIRAIELDFKATGATDFMLMFYASGALKEFKGDRYMGIDISPTPLTQKVLLKIDSAPDWQDHLSQIRFDASEFGESVSFSSIKILGAAAQ